MGFRNLGNFTINAGESFRVDFWTWPNGEDHGAQYFSAHPLGPDAMLIISEQSKVMDANGEFFYGFRVTNAGPNDVQFTVEGGGLEDGYKVDPFDDGFWTLAPGGVMGGGTTALNTSIKKGSRFNLIS